MENLTEARVLEQFGQGFDCSQVVLAHFAEALGTDVSTARRAAAAFGGGMWQGRTCGAVSGALMAIGLKFGHDRAGDAETKNAMLAKKAEFERRFCEAHGSCVCREVLGHDLSIPEGMSEIQSKNLLATLCPKVVMTAVSILEDLLK